MSVVPAEAVTLVFATEIAKISVSMQGDVDAARAMEAQLKEQVDQFEKQVSGQSEPPSRQVAEWRFSDSSCETLGKDRADFGQARKHLLNLRSRLLNAFESWTLDFHAEWSLDSGEFHVQSVFNRHGPGI